MIFVFVCKGFPSYCASKTKLYPRLRCRLREPFACAVVCRFVYEKHVIDRAFFLHFFFRLSIVVVIVFGAYPINIFCQILYFHVRVHPTKLYAFFNSTTPVTILSLYQVVVQTNHSRNDKHFNSTKRNNITRRIRVLYFYWVYNTLSSPADVKQNKRSRVYHRKIQNFSNYPLFGNDTMFSHFLDADVIM